MALGRVAVRLDERVVPEHLLHARALDADAAAVNQPHFAEARIVGRAQVLVHHRRNVARCERVEVEDILDRDAVRVVHVAFSWEQSAGSNPAFATASGSGLPATRCQPTATSSRTSPSQWCGYHRAA